MTEKSTMKLYPFWEVAREAERVMNQGATIHQQFNCQHCGYKQTMEQPNQFFHIGQCEECEGFTDCVKNGCNYLARFDLPKEGRSE